MSGLSGRSNRSFSEPPVPGVESYSSFERPKTKGKRDSISSNLDMLDLAPSPTTRKASKSLSSADNNGAVTPVSRSRKKKQALFGESYDPLALAKADKKVIAKADTSREVRGWSEGRLERSDSKSTIPHTT